MSWSAAAEGERMVAAALNRPALAAWTVLHDRFLSSPDPTDNLDHLLIGPGGVYCVEAARWDGTAVIDDHTLTIRPAAAAVGGDDPGPVGSVNGRVDEVRRAAEAAELRLGHPIEPVLVLADPAMPYLPPTVVRMVTVLHIDDLPGWFLHRRTILAGPHAAKLAARAARAFQPTWTLDPSQTAAMVAALETDAPRRPPGHLTGPQPGPDPWRTWTPAPPTRRRSWSTTLVSVLLIAGLAFVALPGLRTAIADSPWYALWADGDRSAPSERMLPTPPEAQGDGTYAFLATHPGEPDEPVTYDPCQPLHVVMNTEDAPTGLDTERLLDEALARLSAATGLSFVVDGPTSETATSDRGVRDPQYDGEWSPILVAWTTPEQISELQGPVAGIGGSAGVAQTRFGVTERTRYVSGYAYLDGPAFDRILNRTGDPLAWERARAIVMHELAHVVGLGHVESPTELMARENSGLTSFGPGDLAGLRELGQGECRSGS